MTPQGVITIMVYSVLKVYIFLSDGDILSNIIIHLLTGIYECSFA